MQEDLLDKLEAWHEEDEFENIVAAINEIPEAERDYTLISHLGRALNNLERYEEAIEQFEFIADEGKNDPLWNYRMGIAHFYLEQYEEALVYFEAADRLDPDDEDTLEFLETIRSKLPEKPKAEPKPLIKAAPAVFDTDFDVEGFWDDTAADADTYRSAPPSDELVESVEEELVFKLPSFYVQMMKQHNGGVPAVRSYSPAEGGPIFIAGMPGIGRDKAHSLCGARGSRAVIDSGGFPEFGVVICDCPSPDEVIMLDYREAGNDGEPEVVHVDRNNGMTVTPLAPSFEAFVRGLAAQGGGLD